ncbi:MAG: ABC transporter permease [Halobacteriaceae archaeon]
MISTVTNTVARFRDPRRLAGIGIFVLGIVAFLLIAPPELVNNLDTMILSVGFATATIQSAVPLALAGIGGLYAEKSGVINIGLEGLLIVGAFVSVAVPYALGAPRGPLSPRLALWVGFFTAVISSTLLAWLFGVICIRYKADQIIAGLAVWLLALGAAPFGAVVIFGSKNGGGVGIFNRITIPGLAQIPVVGEILFHAYPTTYLMFILVPLAWWVLNRTPYGTWVKASGEHPEALDTAGVNVNRVRYSAVLLSGALSGIGGAAITLTSTGRFIGAGSTMVQGRGFIAIVTYLMGNYNPVGTFLAGILFAGVDALQYRAQQVPEVSAAVPADIVGIIPHISVIIVLVFFGYTRIPARAGEHYEPGEE